jgi:hypothetical protein
MKKAWAVVVFASLIFLFPGVAGAETIGTFSMSGSWDYPFHSVANGSDGYANWSLNYSVSFDGSTLDPVNSWTEYESGDFILGDYEAFCTQVFENIYPDPLDYDLYTIDSDQLEGLGLDAARYLAAAWIAENYGTTQKAEAQLAMWEILEDGADQFNLSDGVFYAQEYDPGTTGMIYHADAEAIYSAFSTADLTGYVPGSSWALAVNDLGQNMIVQNPIPEPSTLLLFGFGLLGLVGARRMMK